GARRPSATQDSLFERGNPRLGLNYNVSPTLEFFLSYGEGFRAPAFLELTRATPAAICPGLQAGAAPDPPIQAVKARSYEAGVDYVLTPWLSASLSMRSVGAQRLRGDEENAERPLSDYVVFGAGLKARFKGLSGFLAIDNLFNARYETFGTFAGNARVAGTPIERFLTPAPPINLIGGLT